ncbi:MAG: hypothetical protein HY913_07390 [Desulfomonile tiedjei]|nr:hypothetical protein [Desulfomonile tiedjei]
MEQQEKENKVNTAISEEPDDWTAAECSEDAPSEKEEQPSPEPDASAENRGRLILAGLVATAILSCIAVLVAGTIQLTSRWLIVCPTDLPVNDPAPILWDQMVSGKAASASLGVTEKLAFEVRFKGSLPEEKTGDRGRR